MRYPQLHLWAVTLFACAYSRDLSAQSLGFFAGTSTLVGRSADSASTGYHVGAFVEFATGYNPLAIRVVAEIQQMTASQVAGPGQAQSTQAPNVFGASLEAVLRVSELGRVRPYLLGSVGIYHFGGGPTLVSGAVQSKFGAGVGVGGEIRLQSVRVFGEVRYQSIAGVQILPVSIGVRF